MATSNKQENKKSFFNCCGCGEKEKNKEVLVDTTAKKLDQTAPASNINSTISSINVPRPPSVDIQRTSVKPRVTFTYSSPPQNANQTQLAYSIQTSKVQKVQTDKKVENTSEPKKPDQINNVSIKVNK